MRRWKKKLIIVDHIHRWYWLLNRSSKQYPEHNLLPPSCKKSSAQFVESFDIALRRRPPFWFFYLCAFLYSYYKKPLWWLFLYCSTQRRWLVMRKGQDFSQRVCTLWWWRPRVCLLNTGKPGQLMSWLNHQQQDSGAGSCISVKNNVNNSTLLQIAKYPTISVKNM